MLTNTRYARFVGALAIASLAIAGCARDSGAPTSPSSNTQPALSATEAQSLGEAMSQDVQGELEAATVFGDAINPLMFAPSLDDDASRCVPTVSPTPVTNADSDRVPDSLRVTFGNCTFAESEEADTVRGSIDIVDPTPKVADRSIRTRFNDYTRIEVEHDGVRSLVLNGVREASRDSAVISQSETNFKSVFTFRDGDSSTHTRNWAVVFTADSAGAIGRDRPLPSGKLGVNGTSAWTHDTSTYSIMVSTSPILHYNATCTSRPKFDSGTFHATVTKHGATSNVTIQFTACGTFTVTRS